jgi:hypothetical protein
LLTDIDIPQANGLVSTARGDMATVSGEIQGIDILFVTGEDISNLFGLDVPNLVLLSAKLSTSSGLLGIPG